MTTKWNIYNLLTISAFVFHSSYNIFVKHFSLIFSTISKSSQSTKHIFESGTSALSPIFDKLTVDNVDNPVHKLKSWKIRTFIMWITFQLIHTLFRPASLFFSGVRFLCAVCPFFLLSIPSTPKCYFKNFCKIFRIV